MKILFIKKFIKIQIFKVSATYVIIMDEIFGKITKPILVVLTNQS